VHGVRDGNDSASSRYDMRRAGCADLARSLGALLEPGNSRIVPLLIAALLSLTTFIAGRSTALINLSARYKLFDREHAPFALTLGIELHWSRVDENSGERVENYGGDLSIAADTTIVTDSVFGAINIIYDPEVTRLLSTGSWQREATIGFLASITTQVQQGVFVGAEARYLRKYDGSDLSAFPGDALFIGFVGYSGIAKIGISVCENLLAQPNIITARLFHIDRTQIKITVAEAPVMIHRNALRLHVTQSPAFFNVVSFHLNVWGSHYLDTTLVSFAGRQSRRRLRHRHYGFCLSCRLRSFWWRDDCHLLLLQFVDPRPGQLGQEGVLEARDESLQHPDVGGVLGPIPRLGRLTQPCRSRWWRRCLGDLAPEMHPTHEAILGPRYLLLRRRGRDPGAHFEEHVAVIEPRRRQLGGERCRVGAAVLAIIRSSRAGRRREGDQHAWFLRDRHKPFGAANAAEVVAAGIEDDEMDGLGCALVEEADDLCELDTPYVEISPGRALDVDGDQEVVAPYRHAMTGIVEKAHGVASCRAQPVGKIVRGVENLVAACILHRGEDFEAHLGERRADDADILVRIFERADPGGIALVADDEGNALLCECIRIQQQQIQQANR
jgi:hypothetical protein